MHMCGSRGGLTCCRLGVSRSVIVGALLTAAADPPPPPPVRSGCDAAEAGTKRVVAPSEMNVPSSVTTVVLPSAPVGPASACRSESDRPLAEEASPSKEKHEVSVQVPSEQRNWGRRGTGGGAGARRVS